MKILSKSLLFILSLIIYSNFTQALVVVKEKNGQIVLDNGKLIQSEKDYRNQIDSLDIILGKKSNDTTALFLRACLYARFNNLVAKAAPGQAGALEDLEKAKNMIENAIKLGMQNFYLIVLRAQVYNELCYRFTGDEAWKFTDKQITERRRRFNDYKSLANLYYKELEIKDKTNSYDYERLKVVTKYPL